MELQALSNVFKSWIKWVLENSDGLSVINILSSLELKQQLTVPFREVKNGT